MSVASVDRRRCAAAPSGADSAKSIAKRPARRSRRNCWRNSISTSGSSSTTRMSRLTACLPRSATAAAARQHDPEFGELAGLGVDLDRAGMLFHDDVVAERQAEAGSFAGRLGREERIEHLLLHLGRNAGAVVADPDLDPVAEVLRRGRKRGLVGRSSLAALRLVVGVEAVGDQVEQHARDFLREEIDLAGGRVEAISPA